MSLPLYARSGGILLPFTLPRFSATAALALSALAFGSLRAQDQATPCIVKKTLEDFSGATWRTAAWSKASGEAFADDAQAPDAAPGKSQRFDVSFSGGGFENFTSSPPTPLYIPGDVKRITLRVKRNDPRYPLSIGFIDGWGRGQVNGAYLSADFRLAENTDWQTVSFDVPKDWVRPVAIAGLTTHNFAATGEKKTVSILVDDIEAETDISGVDPKAGRLISWKPDPNPADKNTALTEAPATPLVTVGVATPESCNVFSSTPPSVTVQVRNWKPGTLTGKASFSSGPAGSPATKKWEEDLSIESIAAFKYPVDAPKYGLYDVNAHIELSDGTKIDSTLALAKVPDQKELTAEQKLISPYGMNYHGGAERLFEAFKKAGIYWFRDYAFGLDMMRRAKGPDNKYAGWPFYPSIVQDYERLGLMVVPILHGISEPVMKDDKPVRIGPDRQWTLDIADIIISFPQIRFWELDNEYDLPFKGHSKLEHQINWDNYRAYHRKFGELVRVLGDGQLTAVENGRAGIYPKPTEDYIRSGGFADIGVVNSHHYCGTEPPEVNAANFNRGLEPGQAPGYFFDNLRALKRAADADGKKRESWMTEFGWDNISGPAVSLEQQAAYLQRAFLMAFAAGTDKAFWFYNFDADKKVQIFDSCGLFTFDKQPKPALSAMAGLTALLPRPVYVGSIEAGPNTTGYVFENDGQLVAGLWVTEGDAGPKVKFLSGKIHDAYANPRDVTEVSLRMEPVYVVGLGKNDPFYMQTAYSLESPYLILATAGDPAEAVIEVKNNRTTEIRADIEVKLPEGWVTDKAKESVTVAPGERKLVPMNFVVKGDEEIGAHEVAFTFTEGGSPVKTIPLRVLVQRPFTMEVAPVVGVPGKTSVQIALTNHSMRNQSGTVRLALPSSWKADKSEIKIEGVAPGETRSVPVEFTWTPQWQAGEAAQVIFQPEANKGGNLEAPIIPNQFRLARAKSIIPDGKLEDWGTSGQIPGWMLGSTFGDANAKVALAWAPEGLYGAVEVQDSRGVGEDPRTFWGQDALELFLSTNSGSRGTSFQKSDHQFWLVPDFANNRVYTGRWKVKDEITETQYDISEIKSAARRTKNGYVMEFLIPASVFTPYGLQSGSKVGLNANLSVKGRVHDREVFWPRKKSSSVNTQPVAWGTAILE